jgi:hypothetical protein
MLWPSMFVRHGPTLAAGLAAGFLADAAFLVTVVFLTAGFEALGFAVGFLATAAFLVTVVFLTAGFEALGLAGAFLAAVFLACNRGRERFSRGGREEVCLCVCLGWGRCVCMCVEGGRGGRVLRDGEEPGSGKCSCPLFSAWAAWEEMAGC